ncbi:MAG: glycosyltransferase [Candidatus Microsaccharimonas sp.]
MAQNDFEKRFYQAQYRAEQVEAELNAVRSSKAYKLTKGLGIVKNHLKSDPIGLGKKAAHILVNNPKKLLHVLRSAERVNFMAQSTTDQTGKYQEWILLNEPDESQLQAQRELADNLKRRPLISIITPVFNPPTDVLEELIESVLEQTYTNFELFLGNFGDDKAVERLIEKYANLDPRVKNHRFKKNLGIAGNSNQILEKIEGEFIALLDHDDTLSPDALYENAKLLNEDDYDFIYSDKDKIDLQGNRFDPLFKAELSPEMLLNINYLTHLNVMKTLIVKKIGGWDSETDGAQDWDLFLRVITVSKKVGFIPKVLYHWRVIESSTAMSIETKPYALAGQRRAIDKYLTLNNIAATSYHKKTELFLRWDKKLIHQNPIVYIYFTNIANTLRTIRHIRHSTNKPSFIILQTASSKTKSLETKLRRFYDGIVVIQYEEDKLYQAIATIRKEKTLETTVIFIKDTIKLPRASWYEDFVGWLAIKDVAATSGRLVNNHDLIVESGAFINKSGEYVPLFQGYPRFYQSYVGNAEWVRNLSILSSSFFATTTKYLDEFNFATKTQLNENFDDFFLWLSGSGKRLVMTPHVTAMLQTGSKPSSIHKLRGLSEDSEYIDPFANPNMSKKDPLRLIADEEFAHIKTPSSVDTYQHDATILAGTFDISEAEILDNLAQLKKRSDTTPKSVAWILPSYDLVYAGLMNIFSFANYLTVKQGLRTTIYILKNSKDVSNERKQAIKAFPGLKSAKFVGILPSDPKAIKQHDIGIATQWATAYPLAKAKEIQRKWYFIQDNETNFYPKGSISSLVELSYRFGFKAVANTPGLLDLYKRNYNGDGVVVKSLVDLSAYFPRQDIHYIPKPTYKVFFYARPNMPRNAFELGVAGLKKLKEQLGDKVEIITAGAEWDVAQYGAEGYFTNLGKVNYDAVPKLYRSVDAGLMFMFSGHPGVTASELMASGCPVVVNEYDDVTWHELYKDGETCVITKATASEVARNIRRCLEDTELRKTLIDNGIEMAKHFYSGYDTSCDKAYKSLVR